MKPDEKYKPNRLMTNRQLAEFTFKSYGEWSFNIEELDFHIEVGYGILNDDKEVDDDILICSCGSKELHKPTKERRQTLNRLVKDPADFFLIFYKTCLQK